MAEETGQKQSKIQNLLELLQKTFLTVRDTINNQVKKHISLPDLQIGLEDEKYPPRGIIFPSRTAPTTTTNKLYNESGTLRFEGQSLSVGWEKRGDDIVYSTGSVGIGDVSGTPSFLLEVTSYGTLANSNAGEEPAADRRSTFPRGSRN